MGWVLAGEKSVEAGETCKTDGLGGSEDEGVELSEEARANEGGTGGSGTESRDWLAYELRLGVGLDFEVGLGGSEAECRVIGPGEADRELDLERSMC